MAQPTGYNQFSNYSSVPGQADQRFPGFGGGGRQSSDLNQQPPTGERQSSQYPAGTFRQQQPYQWQPPQRPQGQAPAGGQAQPPPADQGAAGQAPPDSQPSYQAPRSMPQMPPMSAPAQPSGHLEMGDFGAVGAWTNGYNPHMVYDQPTAPQYPQGTFQTMAPQSAAPAQRQPAPAAPPMPAPAPTAQQEASRARLADAVLPHVQDLYPNVTPQGLGTPGALSTTPEALAISKAGSDLGLAGGDVAFTVANPYYGQTGYYGDLNQVRQQMAGHAQAGGIPTGVLGADTYTQSPIGQPLWQPQLTPQQQEPARLAYQQWMDNVGRFLPDDATRLAEAAKLGLKPV